MVVSDRVSPGSGSRPASRATSTLAIVGLLLICAALLLDLTALTVDLIRNGRLRAGGTLETIGLDFSSDLSQASNLAVPLSVLVGGTAFLFWFWQAYRRLAAVAGTTRDPIWAVIGWFVPVINLYRPPEMMNELVANRGGEANQAKGEGLTWAWWGLWALGALVIVALRFVQPASAEAWANWFRAAIAADVFLLASLLCALALVGRVSRQFD